MKVKHLLAAILLSAAIAAPLSVSAQDAPAAAATPAATATPKAKKQKSDKVTPITGKVASVDKTAKTFKVGEHTFTVTDSTKWEGTLTLDTLTEGTKVTVTYTKDGANNDATDVKAAASKKK